MESYHLAQFPAPYSTVHIALFRNVRNSSTIRTRLIEAATTPGPAGDIARKAVEFAFIDAGTLASKEHLMVAITTTLLLALPPQSISTSEGSCPAEVVPKTRSHNLHSEILLTLHTNNIISEAIKKFGISNTTRDLVVLRFGDAEQEEVWRAMDDVVEGELGPLAELDGREIADWKVLDKIYKLSELNRLPLTPEEIVEKKIAAVINTVAVKSVT